MSKFSKTVIERYLEAKTKGRLDEFENELVNNSKVAIQGDLLLEVSYLNGCYRWIINNIIELLGGDKALAELIEQDKYRVN